VKKNKTIYFLTPTFAGGANGLESSVGVIFIHVTYNHGRGTTSYFVCRCIRKNIHLNGAIVIYKCMCSKLFTPHC
jgi:hypothetical protein